MRLGNGKVNPVRKLYRPFSSKGIFGTMFVFLTTMKIPVLFLALALSFVGSTQNVIPFEDFNFFFKSFQEGMVKQIEMQRIEEYKVGDEFVAYMDNRGNLRIYNGTTKQDLANTNVEYKVSDHLLTWKIGETLNLWDNGKLKTLTFNVNQYRVMDSIVVFTDSRFNTLNVYNKGEVTTVATSTTYLSMPVATGENVFAYKDNGDYYKIWCNGQVTDIDVWQGKINFSAGTDVVAFNDPTTRTFAVYENGGLVDVEDFFVKNYQAGRGFVVYEDLNGNLFKFQNGEKKQLSTFNNGFWQVKDDVVIWMENGWVFMECNGKKWQVCNYKPEEFELKNDVLVFKNIVGGVSVSMNGKTTLLTNQQDASFSIHGSSVLVALFNSSFIVFQNDKKIEL